MDRLSMPSAMPAELAEVLSDQFRDPYTADPRTTDAIYELIGNSDSLKDFLEDEELAGPLAQMVVTLPKCIKEISEHSNLPEYQAMLRLVAQVERVLVQYVEGE